MKKFTFLMIALLCAVVTFAAGPKKQFTPQLFTPAKTQVQLGKQFNAKQAPARLAKQTKATAMARAPKKAATAADLAGTYLWEYAMSSNKAEDPTTVEGTDYSAYVTITAGDDETVTISGMFTNDLTGTIYTEYGVIVVEGGQIAGTSSYGDYAIYGLFYYEGDDEYEAGWYPNDIYIDINEDGSLTVEDWLVRVLSGGDYDGFSLTPYFMPGSTLTPSEAPEVVVAPEGLEFAEYALSYTDYKGSAASGTAAVGIDGDDVYFKGFSSYIPDALIKGTKDGNTITFAANQYLGSYSGYDSYFIEEAVFTYDAEADTYTATGDVYSLLGGRYIDVYATDPVLKGVVEKAAMPADPAITALKNGDYGWYITFNVPNVDVDGNGMAASKLSYMIYTDTEREVSPLTFTPETHTYLTEEMTEIPYGFTEDYDFYNGTIYLNDLYSKDWNKIGIKSIYRGGGEVNETEIQWFDIKDYSVVEYTYTFNFNKMDVPTSSSDSTDGDITEDKKITEGDVTLTISPKEEGKTANRFWNTNAGPQLRVYSGTLTFEVSEEYQLTQINFFYNGKYWGGNNNGGNVTADSGEIEDVATDKIATWTGEAQKVVFTIGANTQINSIVVKCKGIVEEDKLVTLPEGVEAEEFTLTMSNNYGTTEATKLVAFDGDDVYAQGLAYYFPEAFVKGTLNENGQYVFKSGQLVGEDEYGAEYLVGLSVDEEGYLQYEPEFVFDFDAESRTLSLVEGTYFGESGEKNNAALWTYTYSAVYTEGALVLPEPVEAPDVEAETWYLVANGYSGKVKGEEVGVAVDGSDIYLQGLCSSLPEAWVKGTIEDGKATFAGGQFYGTYVEEYEGEEYSYNLFFGGYGIDVETNETYLSDVVFDYDAEAGTLTTQDYILLNSSANYVSFYDYYNEVSITREKPEFAQAVEVPEDLVTEPYMFTGYDTYWEEDVEPYEVQVGFYGADEVYIQGLSSYIEDGWVKGTLENGVLTIPETYIGVYKGWFGDSDIYFPETKFIYDAETATFTCEDGFTTYDDDGYAYDEVSNVVLTKLVEKAATPADPSVKNFILIGVDDDNNTTDADGNPIFFAYPWIGLDIPVVDVDGDPMVQNKLSYVIYIVDKDGIQKELTLTKDLYSKLDEDMTEIPYLFSDNYDIYAGGSPLYLNQDPEEIITWKKIGVQSIYRGLGEEHRSNIGWFDIVEYLGENNITTGIRNFNAGNQDVVYFDLQGRRVAVPGKGLYIANGKKVVLK